MSWLNLPQCYSHESVIPHFSGHDLELRTAWKENFGFVQVSRQVCDINAIAANHGDESWRRIRTCAREGFCNL
jgi:hypothetical protein